MFHAVDNMKKAIFYTSPYQIESSTTFSFFFSRFLLISFAAALAFIECLLIVTIQEKK